MKKSLILSIFILTLMVACGGTAVEDEAVELSGENRSVESSTEALTVIETTAEADELPRATITPPPQPDEDEADGDSDAYPAPLESTSPPTAYGEQPVVPTLDPYPGPVLETLPQPDVTFAELPEGVVTSWVELSSGMQCDEDGPTYEDISEVMMVLEEAEIAVYDGVTESRVVCQACGCPNSIFYRLEIGTNDLETAVVLGFAQSQEE